MRSRVYLVAIALIIALSCMSLISCGDEGPQHLYIASDSTPGQILQYTLPLTSSSTPNLAISFNWGVALAVDSAGNLAAANNTGSLSIFSAPLSSASTASATFNNGTASSSGQILFNHAGDLYAPTQSTTVNVFTHPLTSASTVSQAITTAGLISAIGAAFDANNNLIVANDPKTSNLLVFAPPYTGAPTVTTPGVAGTAYRKIALNGTQLFVANVNAGTGTVDVYNLPLTNTSAPAFSMTNVNVPEAVAFDKSGNLYVGNANDGTIRVFAPPFAAASTPSLTFTMPAGFNIFGMTIGR